MRDLNPLLATLEDLRAEGRAALCGYFLTGYPTPESFYRLVRAARDLDVIEFGIPAEAPGMDGPIIASAHEVVTETRGIGAETALALIGGLREIRQPRFVMTYANVGRGLAGFLRLCTLNGVHGMLAPDLAEFETDQVVLVTRALGMASFTLVDARADDTAFERAVRYGDVIYIKASPAAQTGQAVDLMGEMGSVIAEAVRRLRALKPSVALAIGIGIQRPEQVAALSAMGVDMIIVGTKMVEHVHAGEAALVDYVSALKAATHRLK
jgi:tryptophan synthase alpha chain